LILCVNCGNELEDDAIICPACGMEVRALEDEEKKDEIIREETTGTTESDASFISAGDETPDPEEKEETAESVLAEDAPSDEAEKNGKEGGKTAGPEDENVGETEADVPDSVIKEQEDAAEDETGETAEAPEEKQEAVAEELPAGEEPEATEESEPDEETGSIEDVQEEPATTEPEPAEEAPSKEACPAEDVQEEPATTEPEPAEEAPAEETGLEEDVQEEPETAEAEPAEAEPAEEAPPEGACPAEDVQEEPETAEAEPAEEAPAEETGSTQEDVKEEAEPMESEPAEKAPSVDNGSTEDVQAEAETGDTREQVEEEKTVGSENKSEEAPRDAGQETPEKPDIEAAADMAIDLGEPVLPKEESAEGAGMSKGRSIGALTCGILGLALCWVPVAGLILSIFAMALGAKARNKEFTGKRGMAVAGFIMGVIGLVVSIGAMIWWIVVLTSGAKVFWLLGSLA
jgi:hypothetical protein